MTKQKYVVAASVSFGLLLLLGGSYGYYSLTHKPEPNQHLSLLDGPDSAPAANQAQAPTDNSVALNQTKAAPKTNTGLGVTTSNSATSLGQLGNGGQANTQGTNKAAAGGSNGAAPNPVDPSTFAQYEKYKDGTSALFGDVQPGTGAELTADKKAAVYYKGWLTNGTLFDQSRPGADGKIQPFVFTLGAHQVIPGWEQALAGMKVGGTRLLIVPSSVGYGAQGQGSIPPNATLVFEVQLLAVQ